MKNAFFAELKELLTKYNAMIEFTVDEDSDISGVYGEEMSVYFENSKTSKTITKGWDVSGTDLWNNKGDLKKWQRGKKIKK